MKAAEWDTLSAQESGTEGNSLPQRVLQRIALSPVVREAVWWLFQLGRERRPCSLFTGKDVTRRGSSLVWTFHVITNLEVLSCRFKVESNHTRHLACRKMDHKAMVCSSLWDTHNKYRMEDMGALATPTY